MVGSSHLMGLLCLKSVVAVGKCYEINTIFGLDVLSPVGQLLIVAFLFPERVSFCYVYFGLCNMRSSYEELCFLFFYDTDAAARKYFQSSSWDSVGFLLNFSLWKDVLT